MGKTSPNSLLGQRPGTELGVGTPRLPSLSSASVSATPQDPQGSNGPARALQTGRRSADESYASRVWNRESLSWRDSGLEKSKCPAVFSLLGPLIIPQVFAGQLADAAGKWCHESDTCCLDFVTLIMENFKSRRNSLITF